MMPKVYRKTVQNKHEYVFIFFVLVFVLSIPFWVLGMINPIQFLPGLPISALGAFTPALGAIILIYKGDRLSGVLRLLQRSFDFKRVKIKNWYLVILLVNPAIAVSAYWAMCASGVSLPNSVPLTLTIFPLFIVFFISVLGEEIGWSGCATEPLQLRWGTTTAGVLLGGVWAIWHFIPLVQAHRSLDWIAWWSLGTISLRTIMVWLYFHAGKSVFAAAVFHAMINLCWQLFPNSGSYYDPRVFGLITFCFAIAIFAAQRLPRKGKMSAA
jgi:membrane protease YdiL (CAAX protease family)